MTSFTRRLQATYSRHIAPAFHPQPMYRSRKSSTIMPRIALDDMATLTECYDEGFLHPPKEGEAFSVPSASINERVHLVKADITTLEVDAIVNAANRSLLGGGGVDGRIHSVCGRELKDACRLLNGCACGDAKITPSFGTHIGCKYIIHTVGPVYDDDDSRSAPLLTSCYNRCLTVAVQNGIKSIAFCAVSTGIYGYPAKKAAEIAIKTVREFLEGQGQDADGAGLETVVFCVYENKDEIAYRQLLPNYFPPAPAEEKSEQSEEAETIPAVDGAPEAKPAETTPVQAAPAEAKPIKETTIVTVEPTTTTTEENKVKVLAPAAEAKEEPIEDEWVEVSKDDVEVAKPAETKD